jgi:hypothetical protein
MSDRRSRDAVAVALLCFGFVVGVVELFYRPFALAPFGFLAVLVGSAITAKHRRLGLAAVAVVGLCFLIGASIAVWNSNPLY